MSASAAAPPPQQCSQCGELRPHPFVFAPCAGNPEVPHKHEYKPIAADAAPAPAAAPFDLASLRAAVADVVAPLIQHRGLSIDSIRSPAHLADDVLEALEGQRGLIDFKPPADASSGSAVLTQEQQARADALHSEEELVAFVTPQLSHWICDPSARPYRCVVNSETKTWIPMKPNRTQFNRKPDLWVGPRYIVQPMLPATSGETVAALRRELAAASGRLYVFGTPVSAAWHDCAFPIAAKLSLTNEAAGELMTYLISLSCGFSQKEHRFSRGMVFDRWCFWLITAQDGLITRVERARWLQPGSGPLLRDFFSAASDWELAFEYMCRELQVQPVRTLGVGGIGRVLEVQQGDVTLALKVVLRRHVKQLLHEHERLTALIAGADKKVELRAVLPQEVRPLLLQPRHRHELPSEPPALGAAAGFLLGPVGRPTDATEMLRDEASFESVFATLRTLHRHNETHGDPRLPNLLRRQPLRHQSSLRSPAREHPHTRGVWNPLCPLTELESGAVASSLSSAAAASSATASGSPQPLLGVGAASSAIGVEHEAPYFWVDFMEPNTARYAAGDLIERDVELFLTYLIGRYLNAAQQQELQPLLTTYRCLLSHDADSTEVRHLAKHALAFVRRHRHATEDRH